ncbi:MAG: hypothetical protein GXP27_13335, partial [Planctomycetes bacterium]|nr:hypothetical protein [Planctomycetota bacterium]
GRAALNRWGDCGYEFSDKNQNAFQRNRLRDAVDRRSIPEIKHVLMLLRDAEVKEGYTKRDRPTGLQYVYERFCGTETQIARIRSCTVVLVALSCIVIMASVLPLAAADYVLAQSWLAYISVWVNAIILLVILGCTFYLLVQSVIRRPPHETDRPIEEGD